MCWLTAVALTAHVIMKCPLLPQPNEGSSTSGDLEAEKSSSPASSPGATAVDQQVPFRRSRGFPRILKAGHGIKLGAVVSTFTTLGPLAHSVGPSLDCLALFPGSHPVVHHLLLTKG